MTSAEKIPFYANLIKVSGEAGANMMASYFLGQLEREIFQGTVPKGLDTDGIYREAVEDMRRAYVRALVKRVEEKQVPHTRALKELLAESVEYLPLHYRGRVRESLESAQTAPTPREDRPPGINRETLERMLGDTTLDSIS